MTVCALCPRGGGQRAFHRGDLGTHTKEHLLLCIWEAHFLNFEVEFTLSRCRFGL